MLENSDGKEVIVIVVVIDKKSDDSPKPKVDPPKTSKPQNSKG